MLNVVTTSHKDHVLITEAGSCQDHHSEHHESWLYVSIIQTFIAKLWEACTDKQGSEGCTDYNRDCLATKLKTMNTFMFLIQPFITVRNRNVIQT